MPENCLDPRDFTVEDEFHRKIEFYMVGDKFMRRDLSIYAQTGVVEEVKEVSKIVYAIRWLELCLRGY